MYWNFDLNQNNSNPITTNKIFEKYPNYSYFVLIEYFQCISLTTEHLLTFNSYSKSRLSLVRVLVLTFRVVLKFNEYQISDSEKPKYLLVSNYSTNTYQLHCTRIINIKIKLYTNNN